jgi:hypothetical protein
MFWKEDPRPEGRVVGEGVLLIGVIRLSCYTYNQKPAFNIMGGFGEKGFGIVTEVALEDWCQLV